MYQILTGSHNNCVDLDAQSFPFIIISKIFVVVITLKAWLPFSLSKQAVLICQL